jgi:hypothetical protein
MTHVFILSQIAEYWHLLNSGKSVNMNVRSLQDFPAAVHQLGQPAPLQPSWSVTVLWQWWQESSASLLCLKPIVKVKPTQAMVLVRTYYLFSLAPAKSPAVYMYMPLPLVYKQISHHLFR